MECLNFPRSFRFESRIFCASWNFFSLSSLSFRMRSRSGCALSIFHSCAVRGRSFFLLCLPFSETPWRSSGGASSSSFSSSLSSGTFFLSSSSSSYPPRKTFFPTYSSISSLSTNALSPTGSSIFVNFLAYSSGSKPFVGATNSPAFFTTLRNLFIFAAISALRFFKTSLLSYVDFPALANASKDNDVFFPPLCFFFCFLPFRSYVSLLLLFENFFPSFFPPP